MMTSEEIHILLIELCTRLPYGVRVKQGSWEHTLESANMYNISFDSSCAIPIPYLRPMSSMTEEEEIYYNTVYTRLKFYEKEDWLNAHHFDYRGLIPMKLAIEAPSDMYKIE